MQTPALQACKLSTNTLLGEAVEKVGKHGAKRATQTNLGNGFYDIANRYFVDFRVTATDNVGNATSKTIANGQLTRPYGTFYIVPPFNSSTGFTYADSYQLTSGGGNIGFYGLVSQAVRSGNGISVGGLNWSYGCWF